MSAWGAALVAAAGVALVALGVWATFLRPRRVTSHAFAVYATATGLYWIVFYTPRAFPEAGLPIALPPILDWTLSALTWICLPALALGLPRPLPRAQRSLALVPTIGALAFTAIVAAWPDPAWRALGPTMVVAETAIWGASFLAMGIALARFRAANGAEAHTERAHIALLVTALALVNGVATGSILAATLVTRSPLAPLAYGSTAYLLVLVLAWLLVAGRSARPASRQARDLALVTTGAFAMGGIASASLSGTPADHAALGIVLLASGILLARGALVGGLLGPDIGLRFAISKSTIAAVFIAVFFIASEAAQEFFGETLGSTYVGIAAAGALVFAMAPLQRAAERLAERAVPSLPAPSGLPMGGASPSKEEAYRRAVRLALRDRILSDDEEVHLHDVAEHMGIGAGRAMALRIEVKREMEGSQ